jgi:serine/threonine-protein kinase
VVHATQRNPAARPRDAAEMLAEARAVAAGLRTARQAHGTPATSAGIATAATVPVPARPLEATTASPSPVRHRGSSGHRRRVRIAAAGILTLGVLGAAGWYGPLRYTTSPDVVGLPVVEAQQMVRHDGFRVGTTTAYSDTVAKGRVSAASPGRPWLRRGSLLRLVVSQGPEMHAVPEVTGKSPNAARAAVRAARLRVGVVSEEWSDTVARGLVASTTPGGGVQVRHDSVVALVVSKGPEPVAVPDVTGKSQDDALTTLHARRIAADTTGDYSTSVPKDQVISQGTQPGSTVLPGTHVALVVSLGPPLVSVPHVVGQRISTAVARLEAAGFQVKVGGLRVLGLVLFERPGGGSKRPLGSTISLTST